MGTSVRVDPRQKRTSVRSVSPHMLEPRQLVLRQCVPPFRSGHSLAEREDRGQSLIKRKYTSIHPAVEWHFRKAALNYMGQEDREDPSHDPE